MIMKKTPVILSLQLSLATVVLAACGGGSSSSTTLEGNSIADDVGIAGNTGFEDGATPDADSDKVVLGRRYNNGYITNRMAFDLVSANYLAEFFYNIDTERNIIGDDIIGNVYPDILYDDEGRAIEIQTSPTSEPFELAYNSNDTISSITRKRVSSDMLTTIAFNYEGDRLIGKDKTRTIAGEVNPYGSVTYGYSADGVITDAEIDEVVFGVRLKTSFKFTTDSFGRITEVVELGSDGLVEKRSELTYDTYGNILTEDDYYGVENKLNSKGIYTYQMSPEQAVNLIGLFSDINDVFLTSFDLY